LELIVVESARLRRRISGVEQLASRCPLRLCTDAAGEKVGMELAPVPVIHLVITQIM
jgi:hypothetical protein